MAKEPIKYKYKTRRKPESTKEGMALQEQLDRENQTTPALEVDNVLTGGKKRGHGRGKASDAGPSRKAA
jgi:hypothetical protein